jgi:hypothetical protein
LNYGECLVCDRHVSWETAKKCSEEQSFFCTNYCSEEDCPNRDDCHDIQHPSCWESHIPSVKKLVHRHTPIDPLVERFVHCVTYSASGTAKQRKLHQRDANARWFDIDHEEQKLRMYNRFSQLCDPLGSGNANNFNQYPVIVSFLGNTMAGKSSLIKAIILLSNLNMLNSSHDQSQERLELLSKLERDTSWGPVTRSANLNDLNKPTSRGVHLYKANNTSCKGNTERERILLFADCEGFDGGSQQTNSETYGESSRARRHVLSRSPSGFPRDASQSRSIGEAMDVQDSLDPASELPLGAKSYNSDQGKTGVELFYARFLYAMSNVIVYVADRDGSLQPSLAKFFGWAASAVFHSVNNPSRKTLIIVRHKSSPHDTKLYNEDTMSEKYLESLAPLWIGESKDSPLRKFVENYNSKQPLYTRQINKNRDLFRLLFTEVKCCYIPDLKNVQKKPVELFDQYRLLGKQIGAAADRAQHGITQSWSNYNVPTLTQILRSAFEHFRTSDDAFDFYTAAKNDKSNPVSPADHYAAFLKHAYANGMNVEPDLLGDFISETIAASLVIRELRVRNPVLRVKRAGENQHREGLLEITNISVVVDPLRLYQTELSVIITKAFEIYQQRFQTCHFRFSNGDSCVKRSQINQPPSQYWEEKGLAESHEYHFSLRKAIEPGGIQLMRQETPKFFSSLLGNTIPQVFREKYEEIDLVFMDHSPAHAHKIQRRIVFDWRMQLYQKYRTIWKSLYSNKTCLGCLLAVPDNVLRCGHALCLNCVREFGKPSVEYEGNWTLQECAICGGLAAKRSSKVPYTVAVKPRCAGVRLLTLDGGGVRGIIILSILRAIQDEAALGERVPIRIFFDLIVGTSTGKNTMLCQSLSLMWNPRRYCRFRLGHTRRHCGKYAKEVQAIKSRYIRKDTI